MKAVFNFQVKIVDKQTSVLLDMDECKGLNVDMVTSLSKVFSETQTKVAKLLEKKIGKEENTKTIIKNQVQA